MMSLRWRILSAFILIFVLSILLSISVGYYTTQWRLNVFIAELSSDEADKLAMSLSQEYTLKDGWETSEKVLKEAGYLYKEKRAEERSEESEEESREFMHGDSIRVVIVDAKGYVVLDNFYKLASGQIVPELDGQRATIMNLATNQPVGYAYVDVNRNFMETESYGFLQGTLYTTTIGGMITAVIALLLAAWLSRRITAPVTALTEATQVISEQGESSILPVTSSDELGQMSKAFNKMTTTLQTQRDLRKRLINDVTHELNTPLSVIQLEANGLRDGLQPPADAAEHIISEVKMLRNLVRDLNWLAETDSGELQLTTELHSISQLLTTEVERWQVQAQGHQIDLLLKPLPELPILKLDRMRISQALGNIIHNALQHTEADGRIIVAAKIKKDKYVSITITDDGVGIDPADLQYIFNRYYRTEQSNSRGIYGTGLGLDIAQAIIEAHNGKVYITSDGIGKGATVRFVIPIDTENKMFDDEES